MACSRAIIFLLTSVFVFVAISPTHLAIANDDESNSNTQTVSLKKSTLPVLPSGTTGKGRFGAYYIRLPYDPDWDRKWRVADHADVVVQFDSMPCKFVFWRGTSYIPCWVSENGIWYTNEFCETSGGGTEGCAEPMSDKHARYSHVRIIESNDARVVVHWRYALTDVHYSIAFTDPQTNWGDWVDEYYTIYPDGVGVRKILLWTSRMDIWHEFQECIVINQPGTSPDQNLELAALTIANLQGQSKDYVWSSRGEPQFIEQPKQACLLRVNLKADYKPFLMVKPEIADIAPYGGHAPNSQFNCWDHWPVSQDKSWTRVATEYDKPSHTSLAWVTNPQKHLPDTWQKHPQYKDCVVRSLLHGMTSHPMKQTVKIGRSWHNPAQLTPLSKNVKSQGYDRSERIWKLEQTSIQGPIKLRLDADDESPVVNPAILIENYSGPLPIVKLNDKTIVPGSALRLDFRHNLNHTDLIIWLELESTNPVLITLEQ
ncbi:MAG: hypothetical protein JXD22_15705 [Sedimentisphaerales bacterium]|nr:hypothetical protein [Sedimentisphaerales bacterium]